MPMNQTNHKLIRKNIFLNSYQIIFLLMMALSANAIATCHIPDDLEKPLDKANKQACLAEADFLLPKPNISSTEIIAGPNLKTPSFNYQQTIFCRYFYRFQNGSSNKFRCYRTDENNHLMSSKGQVIANAKNVIISNDDEDGVLADENGKVILSAEGKKIKPDILKVRFQDSNPVSARRNREGFASTVATRMAWSMGIPSEISYPTKAVVCFGCQADPWKKGQAQQQPANETNTFAYAAIERKFDGKRVMKSYDSPDKKVQNTPWKWTDFVANWGRLSSTQKMDYQVLALFANFLQIVEERGSQHMMVCEKENVTDDKVCLKPVAAIHDMGAAFGNRDRSLIDPETKNHPRGDLTTYKLVHVFNDSSCTLNLPAGGLKSISEAARQEFVVRAKSLTRQTVQSLVTISWMNKMDQPLRAKLNKRSGFLGFGKKKSESQIDDLLINEWTNSIMEKLEQIRSAHCPQSEGF
jgi:hypothetical protein